MRLKGLRSPAIWLITAALFLSTAIPASAQANMVKVLISFKKPTTTTMERNIRSQGGVIVHRYHRTPVIAATIPENMIERLKSMPGIENVEPDGVAYALEDTLPWGIGQVNADDVHYYCQGQGVKVAVIDTGIDLDHPDLRVAGQVSFISGISTGDDDNGHGTHVAGTIAALDNGSGVVGIAPESDLYAVKALNAAGQGYWSNIIEGIEWCIDNQIQVINMSLGGTSGSTALQTACNEAEQAGIVLVASAGNTGNSQGTGDTVNYPAKYTSVIAVAATDSNNNRASFSSTGPTVELAAPGYNIYSTYKNGSYDTKSGTSMAAPHVTGMAALIIAAGIQDQNQNGRINDEVRDRLKISTLDLGTPGKDNLYGYGLVQADLAVPPIVNEPPEAPVVEIQPDPAYATDLLTCTISQDSFDPDGDSLTYSYAWFKDTVLQPDLTSNQIPAGTIHKGETWQCQVTPFDGLAAGPTGEDQITIRNSPPEAEAGDYPEAMINTTITLNGLGSLDADGDPLTYAWTQTSGPGITLADETSPQPAFSPTEPGDYVFSLTVYDGEAYSQADTAGIHVEDPTIPTMKIAKIDIALSQRFSGFKTSASVKVYLVDKEGKPVSGVQIKGHWESAVAGSASGLTNSSGTVSFTSPNRRQPAKGSLFVFVVDSAAKSGWVWDQEGSVIRVSTAVN